MSGKRILFGFLFAVHCFFSITLCQAQTVFQAGKTTINLGELPTERTSSVTLWYPQSHCEKLLKDTLCLDGTAVTDRTIVLSHGAMGAADNYQWLGEALAQAGYIVVGVNHFGESWFYGNNTQNMMAAAMLWQRPEDISAIYNVLSNRNLFQRPVNWSNIIAIGHSSGGQTVAMLSGVQYDLNQILDFCKSSHSEGDHSCDYGQRNSAQPGKTFFEKMQANYRDARVKKAILLDPTLGYGAKTKSLSQVALPTLVIGAKNNDFLPWKNHAGLYGAAIPHVKSFDLEGQEGHFVFLDVCEQDIRVMGVSMCHDREGVDRHKTHELLKENIIEFVKENNMAIDPPVAIKIETSRAHSFTASTFFSNILMFLVYTPIWVWGLFAFLVLMGVLQSRDRHVPLRAAYIIPIVMLVLSLSSIIANFGITGFAILGWALGVLAVQALVVQFGRSSQVLWKPDVNKFWIRGSWLPLAIFVGIFAMRYALGAGKAMQASFISAPEWVMAFSILSGALSGFFLSRMWLYIKAKRASDTNHSALV